MKFLTFLSLLFISFLSEAQHPKMIQYTIEDGIPGSEVFDVTQDDRGYIWIATNNGISKFNGTQFESFYKKDGLPDNSVIEFYKDQKGRIWIITYKNNFSYLVNDKIYQYKYNYKLKDYEALSNYCINSIAIKNEDIYIGWENNAIIKINLFGKIDTIKYFSEAGLLLHILPKNEFVFTHKNPFDLNYLIHIQEKDSDYFIQPFIKKQTTRNTRIKFSLNGDYIAASNGKHLFLVKNKKIISQKSFESDITKLKFDHDGTLMVCTYNNGIYFYPKAKITLEAKFNLLKEKTITSVFHDNAGGYWICTMRNGVYYIPSLDFLIYNISDGLKENYINNLAEGNNELWFSTINNFVGVIKNNNVKHFDLSHINSFKITHIIFDKSKNILWGGFEGGTRSLFQIDKSSIKSFKNEEFNEAKNKSTKNNRLTVYVLIQNSKSIITGTSNWLIFFNKENQNRILTIKKNFSVHTMDFGEKNNEIWIGNRDGLYYLKDDILKYYGNENELFKKRVIDLNFNILSKQLWVATKDSGIYVLFNDRVKPITINDGLSGNNITTMCVNNNRIWVGTTEGLDFITLHDFDKFNFEINHFNKNKGLASNFITDIIDIYPYVYIATNKGISFFDYTKIKKNFTPPPIYITSIRINNSDTILKDQYKLSHNQNFININYDGLDFRSPNGIVYMYKMVGLNKTWKKTSSNKIEFTALPPGKYKFYLFALSEEGTWSESPAKIMFIINRPFYNTWWFYSIIVLTIIFITASIIKIINRVRNKELKKRNVVEKELIKEQQKALGQQINPHFIFNTLSSIQYYLYKKDKIESSVYLEKFSQLMRNILYNSQNEFILLKKELDSLKTYMELEQLRFDESFMFEFNIDENIDISQVKIPAFLIQPFIENSIWHGINQMKEKGMIKINFKLENDYITCSIQDNGIGRDASMKNNKNRPKSYKSLGGKITEKRLELINYLYKKNLTVKYFDLKDETGNATGTRVVLSIPAF